MKNTERKMPGWFPAKDLNLCELGPGIEMLHRCHCPYFSPETAFTFPWHYTNTLALLLIQTFYVLLLLHGWDHLQISIFHCWYLPALLFSSPLPIQKSTNLLSLLSVVLPTGFSLQIKYHESNGAPLPNMSTGNLCLWTYLEGVPCKCN